MDTIIIHKTRNTAAPPKIKYVVSVSATKAEGGPSILMEHFSPKPKIYKKSSLFFPPKNIPLIFLPAILEAWQAKVPKMAATASSSPSLAFLSNELACLEN